MKRIFTLIAAFLLVINSYASFTLTTPPKNASDVFITIGKTGKQISLMDLSEIKTKDFETISGRHLNVFDKAGFKLAQRKLRQSINEDGTINNKKLNKVASEMAKHGASASS